MNDLVVYNPQAIANITNVEEAKDGYEKLRALVSYYRKDFEKAFPISVGIMEYVCRIAELIEEMQEKGELATRGGDRKSNSQLASLKDIDIGWDQSSRYQKIKSVPRERRLEHYSGMEAKSELITFRSMLNLAKEQGKEEKEERHTSDHITKLEDIELIRSDFREVSNLPAIDIIITDPPYPKEFLPLYTDLFRLAENTLKIGGSLLIMCGQSYLQDIFRIETTLNYQWTLAYLTPGGQSPQLWTRKVNCFWKPVLWFVKDAYSDDWHGDVYDSKVNDNDKRFHEWGQSESGMAKLIEEFTLPDETILDPFLGGGTTGFVAAQLGRKFIGIEKDKEKLAIAEQRIYDQKAE